MGFVRPSHRRLTRHRVLPAAIGHTRRCTHGRAAAAAAAIAAVKVARLAWLGLGVG